VAVINETGGNWQEKVVVTALRVVPISKHMPDAQAATFFVNPATAFIMTRLVLKVPPRAWLLQTAAGSALGRMVIRLGRHFGFRTINVSVAASRPRSFSRQEAKRRFAPKANPSKTVCRH